MWLLPILSLFIGVFLGYLTKVSIPTSLATYTSVALLAALDSVLGGIRSTLEGNYNNIIFLSGFFSNTLLAGVLAYIGDKMGINLYMAAVFAFGVRLFQNLAIVRRLLIARWEKR